MIEFGLGLKEWKKVFFDVEGLTKAVDGAAQRVLSLFGRNLMRLARKSIRNPPGKKIKEMTDDERRTYRRAYAIAKRKGLPLPRKPRVTTGAPRGHAPYNQTGLLKQFILYGYEPSKRNVIIGAARLGKMGDAPHALEYSGRSIDTRSDARGKSIFIQPHPFMRPAMEAERPKLSGMWANSIKP